MPARPDPWGPPVATRSGHVGSSRWRRGVRLRTLRCMEGVAVSNQPLTEEEKAQVHARVQALEIEHGDLDDVIARLSQDPAQDQVQLRRLKKRKLQLKDQITRLESELIPDLNA
jgi:hypothetical protein